MHVTITGLPHGLAANPVIVAIELMLALYFVTVNFIDFALIAIAMWNLPRIVKTAAADVLQRVALPFARPVSILLPVFNEDAAVVSVVHALLRVRYPKKEVIVINDGSTDGTFELLKKEFRLIPIFEAGYVAVRTKPIRGIYRSMSHPELRLVDKENGGKGDALNAGLNDARFPLLLTGDGDSLYTVDALERMIQPFLADPTTVACGASLRILNGGNALADDPGPNSLPRKLILRLQVLEYLRSALTSRFGWAPINGLMSLSGACALWNKEVIVAAGGFSANTIWEDLEMTVRVHHLMQARGTRYRVAFVPAAVCWTHVPDSLAALQDQRIGWQRHLTETIVRHRRLLFSRRGGVAGTVALPALVVTELIAPFWLIGGLAFVGVTAYLGILSISAQIALLALVFTLTILKSASALLLDEVSYRTLRAGEIWSLFLTALIEPFGYRQLNAVWNLVGTVKFFAKRPIRRRTHDIPSWKDPPYEPVIARS